ncbi:MAK10-like protein, partial [Tanacetum coccineum]
MGDENPPRTLGDYSRPSHEGYRNTIELPDGNNVVSLRSDSIRLVQNGCAFYGLRSEDPNQHLKDFLKLVDSLDLNFFPPGRTTKLRNDILMFQQHHGESLSEAWTRFKDLLQKVPHHGFDIWLQVQIFYDHVNLAIRHVIDHSDGGGKLRDKSVEESWELIENLALYDTSDRRLIELENQVQCLMEAHLASKPSVQVNKITSSFEICGGPHNTQICMENPEQAFVDYASSCTDEAG